MAADSDSKFQRILETAGLYCTRARLAVLKVLSQTTSPLSQSQITQKLIRRRFDRVTIYRVLDAFVKAGLVHRAFTADRTAHFELPDRCTDHQCHPHFTCTDCGRTHCMHAVSIPLAKNPGKGFVIYRQQTRFEGLCPKCSTGRC